jgi:hypothetical protein
MSWSSDIRCLYCDGKLPLYRKITSGQFCSAPHRKLYWQEQERLGVERLHQTHDSLRAFRPPEGVEAILGTNYSLPEEPAPSGPIQPTVTPKLDESPSMIASDPFSYESDLAPQTPLWAPQIAADHDDAPAPMAGFMAVHAMPHPRWPMDRLVVPDPHPLGTTGPVWIPLRTMAALIREVVAAGATAIPVEPRSYEGAREVEPMHPTMQPTRDVAHAAQPSGSALAADADDDVPRAEKLLALAAFAAHESTANGTRRDPWPAAPFSKVQKAHLPLATMERNVKLTPAALPPAGLRSLSIDQVPLVHGTWIDSLRAMRTEGESPRFELSTPAMRPRLRLAAGSRYPVATRDQGAAVATIEPQNLQPSGREVAIPERQAMTMAAAASASGNGVQTPVPGAAGPIPLAAVKPNEPSAQPAPSMQSLNLPQPLRTEPMRPASHLEPLDAKPVADFMAPSPLPEEPKKDALVQASAAPPPDSADEVTPWTIAAGFWKNAPRDLKLLVFGIPILLALALHPSLKKISVTAPQQANGIQRNIEKNFQSKLNDQWKTVKQTMVDRAAIALDEDFRAGLDDWTSRGGTTEWAFDATGFVRPGPLALYRPSVDLTDYQLQFLGMIDKKALSWVVRAADFDDYYVVKLVVLKPGPVPTIGVTRYAVIHGVAQDRSDTTAFINAREDMLYRVRMDIHGDTFALTVQGQLVDSWSETRLRKGGVGFFTARGEASRLRWVQVTHQYDMLGRLCAYLAPYDIPSTNGGWQP